MSGDLTGSVFGDDSTLIVDAVSNKLHGNLTGNVTGDVTGSVFSDNSTLLIDAVNGAISVANADLVGTVDNGTGVDVAGGVTGYLQVTVNGANKFVPLYDPA